MSNLALEFSLLACYVMLCVPDVGLTSSDQCYHGLPHVPLALAIRKEPSILGMTEPNCPEVQPAPLPSEASSGAPDPVGDVDISSSLKRKLPLKESGEKAQPAEVIPASRERLKRSKQFSAVDVEAVPLSEPAASEAPSDVKPVAGKQLEKAPGKYDLPSEPAFVASLSELASNEDPPLYAGQGADVGKTRGRRPKKQSRGKAAGKKAKKGKKRVRAKGKGKTPGPKAKAKGKAAKPKQYDSATSAAVVPKKSRRPQQEAFEGPKPEHHGPLRTPPEHITANHVYSSAYRKNCKQSDEFGRMAGQMAATMFRSTGQVDDLCGVFRSARKKLAVETSVEK